MYYVVNKDTKIQRVQRMKIALCSYAVRKTVAKMVF
jgi:hypothetical protein